RISLADKVCAMPTNLIYVWLPADSAIHGEIHRGYRIGEVLLKCNISLRSGTTLLELTPGRLAENSVCRPAFFLAVSSDKLNPFACIGMVIDPFKVPHCSVFFLSQSFKKVGQWFWRQLCANNIVDRLPVGLSFQVTVVRTRCKQASRVPYGFTTVSGRHGEQHGQAKFATQLFHNVLFINMSQFVRYNTTEFCFILRCCDQSAVHNHMAVR